jgi:hypothetical protein
MLAGNKRKESGCSLNLRSGSEQLRLSCWRVVFRCTEFGGVAICYSEILNKSGTVSYKKD